MPYDDFEFSIRAEKAWRQFPPNVIKAIENRLAELLDADEDKPPKWTEKYNDGATGTRKFEVEGPDYVAVIGYSVDAVNNAIFVTSVLKKKKKERDYVEIRFFSPGKEGRPPVEDFLIEARGRGVKGFAQVVAAMVQLIKRTVEFPLIKSLSGKPGLDELRPEFGDLCYRVFFGYFNNGKVALLLGGVIKTGKEQQDNQDQIELAYKRLKIAKKDLDGNSLKATEISRPVLKSFIEEISENL